MIHKIKSMYDAGDGSSIRAIAERLQMSRNTVRKYLRLDESQIADQQQHRERAKELDRYRDYLVHLLQRYPRLSAVKVQRKLRQQAPELVVSARSLRRYLHQLKATISVAQPRYYEPIIDCVAGVQCQVDGGELRQVLIGGEERTVYFMVFVLSYSRLLHVSASARPINTERLIQMHDAAFRAFGGVPQECVYDQTKLVVIDEEFRELILNPRFAEYASVAGFEIRACEGYDPESKGKVEAGVKYVKNDGLYGEEFADWSALEGHLSQWLEQTANQRYHATTGERPDERFQRDEQPRLKSYLSPTAVLGPRALPTRKADKTGLIAWQGNKYSVPLAYQRACVGIDCDTDQLHIYDLDSGACLATHRRCADKGQIIKNTNHYRDYAQRIDEHEHALVQHLGEALGTHVCQVLKRSAPKIYKDQLQGVLKLVQQYPDIPPAALTGLFARERLSARQLRDYFEAYRQCPQRLQVTDVAAPASAQLLAAYHALSPATPGEQHHG